MTWGAVLVTALSCIWLGGGTIRTEVGRPIAATNGPSAFTVPSHADPPPRGRSLNDRSWIWPTRDQWIRTLTLRDYNSRIVLLGAGLLGGAAGLVGSFMLLRKQALTGDTISHATLPGIGIAFMLAVAGGGTGKSLPWLLLGGSLSGMAGVLTVVAICRWTRIKEDAALGIVLSVFFGAGMSLLGVIQQMQTGHAAGLEAFIYGKTASMSAADARLIAFAAGICLIGSVTLFKELKLLCFDESYAGAQGYPVVALDLLLMSLVVLVCMVGLQAVGLVLVIALLVIPAAAARFWTDAMGRMALLAALFGAGGGLVGAACSALFPRLPSGALIVLICSLLFFLSMVCGTRRGMLASAWRRVRFNRKVDRLNLLRELLPISSGDAVPATRISIDSNFRERRGWSRRRLRRTVEAVRRIGAVQGDHTTGFILMPAGREEIARLAAEFEIPALGLDSHGPCSSIGRNGREEMPCSP